MTAQSRAAATTAPAPSPRPGPRTSPSAAPLIREVETLPDGRRITYYRRGAR